MATNIVGVSMTQPATDPNIQTGGIFTMGGQISAAGGGGWAESGDMYFEWDQGSGSWTTIGTSGDLYHSTTNPITGLQTAAEQTITIYGSGVGTFQVRVKLIEDDLTEYTTAAQTVTVSAPANEEAVSDSADHLHTVDNINLTQKHVLTIAPDPWHDHLTDQISLAAAIGLDVAPADMLHTADDLLLTVRYQLAVDASDHLTKVDPVNITARHQLTVAAIDHTIVDTLLILSSRHYLTLSAIDHVHVIEALSLSGAIKIVTADIAHLHSAEAATLTCTYLVSLQSLFHTAAADAVELALSSAQLFLPANELIMTADELGLSGVHQLAIADADHDQLIDGCTPWTMLIDVSALALTEVHGRTTHYAFVSATAQYELFKGSGAHP